MVMARSSLISEVRRKIWIDWIFYYSLPQNYKFIIFTAKFVAHSWGGIWNSLWVAKGRGCGSQYTQYEWRRSCLWGMVRHAPRILLPIRKAKDKDVPQILGDMKSIMNFSGVARPQATGALARGVEEKILPYCSDFTLFDTVWYCSTCCWPGAYTLAGYATAHRCNSRPAITSFIFAAFFSHQVRSFIRCSPHSPNGDISYT
jgi:hypothetical protein